MFTGSGKNIVLNADYHTSTHSANQVIYYCYLNLEKQQGNPNVEVVTKFSQVTDVNRKTLTEIAVTEEFAKNHNFWEQYDGEFVSFMTQLKSNPNGFSYYDHEENNYCYVKYDDGFDYKNLYIIDNENYLVKQNMLSNNEEIHMFMEFNY
ncbi:MAG: hypothetical protein J0G32_00675 [Alphaproteobacteria bacterium]|nr:hypothetical protein [Alphaproteobacteria bacterium]OJV14087.1 MAG: hypothetical protein BGO27_01200 [Alphaproteobacteria bacterium 33-17]